MTRFSILLQCTLLSVQAHPSIKASDRDSVQETGKAVGDLFRMAAGTLTNSTPSSGVKGNPVDEYARLNKANDDAKKVSNN